MFQLILKDSTLVLFQIGQAKYLWYVHLCDKICWYDIANLKNILQNYIT